MLNPDYYKGESGTFLWDVLEDFYLDKNFNIACVAKYIFRAGRKHQKGLTMNQSKLKDLNKALTFLQREINKLTREETEVHQQVEIQKDSRLEA